MEKYEISDISGSLGRGKLMNFFVRIFFVLLDATAWFLVIFQVVSIGVNPDRVIKERVFQILLLVFLLLLAIIVTAILVRDGLHRAFFKKCVDAGDMIVCYTKEILDLSLHGRYQDNGYLLFRNTSVIRVSFRVNGKKYQLQSKKRKHYFYRLTRGRARNLLYSPTYNEVFFLTRK